MGFYWGGELIIMLEIVPVLAGVFCILSRKKLQLFSCTLIVVVIVAARIKMARLFTPSL